MEPPETVRQWFIDAGWHPGRSVIVPASVPIGHPAREVLAAFGGLVIVEREPKDDWLAIEELVFGDLAPDPDVTVVWGRLLRSQLIGIAHVCNGHAEMYMDAVGRCFGRSLMHDAFYFHGESFLEAIESILLNRPSRPMLRPDQPAVVLYGICFTHDSPEVYRYGY